ncbi:MAG: IS5 family transposase, partial [Bacteroidota bacterium]
ASKWVGYGLAFIWFWAGVVYHLLFFTAINPAAYGFGAMFILQGAFFLRGTAQDKLMFWHEKSLRNYVGIGLTIFGLLIYPLLAYILERELAKIISIGLPCPTALLHESGLNRKWTGSVSLVYHNKRTEKYQSMTKVNQELHKSDTPKVKYQVTNWSSYNNALKNRGNITLYLSDDVYPNWYSDLPALRGGQQLYSDLCIESLMMIKCLFKLPYRQLEGFTLSLFKLMQVEDLKVPCYSQICRRAKELEISSAIIPTKGSIVIAIDSTGVKVYGEGEWKVRKHGVSKRRTWRKLHLGVDPATNFIHCHTLTLNDVDDGSQLDELIDQVVCPIKEATLDGAYDFEHCWDSLIEKGIRPIIPPRSNAVEWYLERPGDYPQYPRNAILKEIEKSDRKTWKKNSGYHQRSLSETAMFRYKTLHGPTFFSRSFHKQKVENDIKIKMLNIMTAQGMPNTIPRKTA